MTLLRRKKKHPHPGGPVSTSDPSTPVVYWMNLTDGAYAVSDADMALAVAALNVQAADMAAAWGPTAARVHRTGPQTQLPAGAAKGYVLNDSDQAGALGYHDVDPQGDPYIRVFTAPTLANGGTVLGSGVAVTDGGAGSYTVSVTMSHEACEEAGDPTANVWSTPDSTGSQVALEACDACESYCYPITVDGTAVSVSDFLLPAYFDLAAVGPFDHMALIGQPRSLGVGGYEILRDASGNVTQKFAREYPQWRKRLKRVPASRTWRRMAEGRR